MAAIRRVIDTKLGATDLLGLENMRGKRERFRPRVIEHKRIRTCTAGRTRPGASRIG